MDMITLEDLMNEIHTEITCETLTGVDALFEDSAEVLFDMLAEEGSTTTELVMYTYFVNRYIDVLRELIDDAFEIGTCDGDCENCSCSEE